MASASGILGYGVARIVLAVWDGGLKPLQELQTMGFGQVVALGLLALTLLAVTEINNEQKILDENILVTSSLSSSSIDVAEEDLINNNEISTSDSNSANESKLPADTTLMNERDTTRESISADSEINTIADSYVADITSFRHSSSIDPQ
ncbi:hypothetical protein EK21DRAFT_109385 [Setomelanomma holmii]|uniref:Uncharacterized protein n=1 Tax=Setomelanomma holmii TaxID=210430 RepID=A0A9P4HE35_9PLEO|nr:hypothetical protein EK21DRAFT_109385 [Setomelanomma holmii]